MNPLVSVIEYNFRKRYLDNKYLLKPDIFASGDADFNLLLKAIARIPKINIRLWL